MKNIKINYMMDKDSLSNLIAILALLTTIGAAMFALLPSIEPLFAVVALIGALILLGITLLLCKVLSWIDDEPMF